MVDMALLVSDGSRIEGPQTEVLYTVFGALVRGLEDHGFGKYAADDLAMTVLVRIQAQLAAAGLVTRDIEANATT
jgi:hypothetical protein